MLGIISLILEALQLIRMIPKKTTMLMYNALRNHPLLKESWTVLIKKGLLTHDDTTQTFKTTEKGLRLLESIAK
jgi:predicted transcriptional regulator